MFDKTPLSAASARPQWQRPFSLLVLMAIAMPLAFSTWSALLNNFVIEVADFDGSDIGLLHTIREIPGFLSFLVIFVIIFIREQVLGMVSLVLLGAASAVTAWFPSLGGILMITFLSSVGFHYYETVNQSLQLQWLKKDKAPQALGWLTAVGAASTLVIYVLIVMTWETLGLSYNFVFMVSGSLTVAIALFALLAYPQYESETQQTKKIVLKKRYWLYYALTFMAGARRQIFIVFAGFMMVEKFGFDVHHLTGLYLINLIANMVCAPLIGLIVARFGEQKTLLVEYLGLVLVFLAYGGIYFFGWGVLLAMVLYVLDHLLFSMALAMKTYFQKIADPEDIAPTAAVAFTINHIAAVFLPVLLGLMWLFSPAIVFFMAASGAAISFCLALLIPRHPVKGYETRLIRPMPAPAE
ncbi:MFS transporter [Cognatishimia sp.]|uniref:MFS transporter n=1 Tax=Cognatishimia sp. TaxID=2211648 RepID=UPI003516A45F